MSTLATPSHFLHDTFITKSQKQHPNTISSMQYIEYLLDAAVTTCRVCLFVFSVIFGEGGGVSVCAILLLYCRVELNGLHKHVAGQKFKSEGLATSDWLDQLQDKKSGN